MVVPKEDKYNFAYVLPQTDPTAETIIVVPLSLQMGWKLSPPFFCAGSETACDVAQALWEGKHGPLPPYPMEDRTLTPTLKESLAVIQDWTSDQPLTDQAPADLYCLLEVYINNFIGLLQTTNTKELIRCLRALLHDIPSVFPPPSVTGHDGHDPISEKKIDTGDRLWETRKEILGWIFDGLERTMELPQEKMENKSSPPSPQHGDNNGYRTRTLNPYEASHAALGLPNGQHLLQPVDKALRLATTCQQTVQI